MVGKIAQFPSRRNFRERDVNTGLFVSIHAPVSRDEQTVTTATKSASGPCHNTGIANTNRMPA